MGGLKAKNGNEVIRMEQPKRLRVEEKVLGRRLGCFVVRWWWRSLNRSSIPIPKPIKPP